MSIYDNKKELLDSLSIKENFLYGDFSNKFFEKLLPKKSGGQRTINPPIESLKKVQRTILDEILKQQTILPCVYGLSAEKNILENARCHQKNAEGFVLILDIKDFFPSIKHKDIFKYYRKIHFNNENAKILTKLSTFNNCLPQGSPSSCHLASFCLESLDKKIYSYCRNHKLTYSRYIDDITISGSSLTEKEISYLTNLVLRHGYELNTKKALLLPDQDKIINNLLVLKDKIIVPNEYKKEITNSFNVYNVDKDPVSYARFIGKLGFYIFVNKKEALSFCKSLLS